MTDTPSPMTKPRSRSKALRPNDGLRLSFGRLEDYVLRRVAASTLIALAVLSSIIFLIDFVEISRTVGVRSDFGSVEILGLMLLKAPSVILILLPFVFLFGALAAFVSLNRKSELIAMRAAGVSAWRFVFPAMATAAVAGILTVFVLNPVTSLLSERYERISQQALMQAVATDNRPVFLRQGDGQTQIVVRAQSRTLPGNKLEGVSLWIFNVDSVGNSQFSKRIDAATAILKPGFWELYKAREASPGEQALDYDVLSIPSVLDPRSAFESYASPESTPFWQLPNLIHEIENAGFSATSYRLRLHQLLATPVMFAAMAAMGAVFSLRLMRLGGLARLAASGVALGFVIFFFNQFCAALGKAEIIPVFLAGWSTPVVALLSAVTLLCYTEDG